MAEGDVDWHDERWWKILGLHYEESDNVLVYSVRGEVDKIYILDGAQSVEIAEREGGVSSLGSHRGIMYDGSAEGVIYETLTGAKIAERDHDDPDFDNGVMDLVSHNGTMHDGGMYGIYETLTGEEIVSPDDLNGGAGTWMGGFCFHKDTMYNGSWYGIWDSLREKNISGYPEHEYQVDYLVSHKDDMYATGVTQGHESSNKVAQVTAFLHGGGLIPSNEPRSIIFNAFTGEKIAHRGNAEPENDDPEYISDLIVHNEVLLDCGKYGLLETLTGKQIVEGYISAMASVPRNIFEEAGLLEQIVSD